MGSVCGPCSSVGIATDYGLDSPGSNPHSALSSGPERPHRERSVECGE